ncbi:MAG: hypothetical protein ACLUQ6_04125 [Alistipes onderdonkii]
MATLNRVDGLQTHQDTLYLLEIASQSQRIVDHRAQFALGIDEEYGTHGCRLAFTGLDHAVKVRHLHRHVRR